jgi:hypothetical protein
MLFYTRNLRLVALQHEAWPISPSETQQSISPELGTLLEFQHITRESINGQCVEVNCFAFTPG